jgi:GTP-binding protein HflX
VSFASSGARERQTHQVLAARAKALVVAVDFGQPDFSDSVEEVRLLTETAGAEVSSTITSKRSAPDPALFVGSGKAHDIGLAARAGECELVVFDHALTPAQQRNLEKELQTRVIDRTSLILDIFAQRAQSHEGKIQVELAQLQHLSTRLIRGWTHLERQKGGIGLRGPGETQLETDRRLIGERVKMLRKKLAHRLYQCRQIHLVQCPDQGWHLCRRPVICHAGHDNPAYLDCGCRANRDIRYGRIHPRPATFAD